MRVVVNCQNQRDESKMFFLLFWKSAPKGRKPKNTTVSPGFYEHLLFSFLFYLGKTPQHLRRYLLQKNQ